jgi:hypothetical protein
MNPTHTVSVGIGVEPAKVYAWASDPANLPFWASGFVQSIERRGKDWIGKTTLGEARFRFAAINEFGVLDHDVELPSGTFHNPIRVVPNGQGSEVLFTLFRLPGISDEQFKTDMDTVRADLNKLRTELEHRHGNTQ